MDRQTGNFQSLATTQVSRYIQRPVFTPDGKRILFLAATEWNSNSRPIFSLWSVGTDGKNPKQIAPSVLFTDPLNYLPNR
jgi:Tol biopolymer transport system component